MTKKNFGTTVIIAIIITAIAFSILSLASLSEHSCSGERCHLCLVASGIERLLKELLGGALALSLALYIFTAFSPVFTGGRSETVRITPVVLRVKLLN